MEKWYKRKFKDYKNKLDKMHPQSGSMEGSS
jgi:hypothetical protein